MFFCNAFLITNPRGICRKNRLDIVRLAHTLGLGVCARLNGCFQDMFAPKNSVSGP